MPGTLACRTISGEGGKTRVSWSTVSMLDDLLAAMRRLLVGPLMLESASAFLKPDLMKTPNEARALRPLPNLIFASRWLQLPLYLGLIVAQAIYVWLFWQELYYLLS